MINLRYAKDDKSMPYSTKCLGLYEEKNSSLIFIN